MIKNRNNKKTKDPIAPFEDQILKDVNTNKKEYLELYAKYFGGSTRPELVMMTEVDSLGILLVFYVGMTLNN